MSLPPPPPPPPRGSRPAAGPPPQWWAPGPPPGPPRGNRNWLLLGFAFLTVIAVSVAATVYLTHRGSSGQAGSGGGSSAPAGGLASGGDTGPVGIITEDPTCEKWGPMENDVVARLGEWAKRDISTPASAWTPEQRRIHESAANVLRSQADRVVALAKETPHRVMRELYEQQIAYSRAYADAVANYSPADNDLVQVSNSLAGALNSVCTAIKNFSAAARAPSVPAVRGPTAVSPLGDPANPQRFFTAPSSVCAPVKARAQLMDGELGAWMKTNSNSDNRSDADKILWVAAGRVLSATADEYERLGRSSGDPVTEDFLVLASQYYRAFVNAMPTSKRADDMLYESARYAQLSVNAACDTVPG